jgi:PAS domain S-box-containing protein
MVPGLDGFALLRELRASESTATVPVIMLSARAGEEARLEGMEAGADDYLIKPFSARELLARVKAHLDIARIRNEAREAMHYRSAQYETLLRQAPLGVYVVDADFRIREVNPMALPVFGDIPDLIGRDFDEVIHILWTKEYADEVVRIFRNTLETGQPHETSEWSEYRIDRKATEYYEWRFDRIVLSDGRYGVVCYFRDISIQVQARVKIAESEERYRGIVNQSVGGIAEADATGRFITVNAHCCKITGYTREEMLNLRMQDLTHPDDRPRSIELLDRLIAGGEPYEIEKRYVRKDGSVIWIHKSVSAIRDLHGKVQSLIAILIDITKSKQTEETLQQMNLQLENLVEKRTAQLVKANQALKENRRRLIDVQEEERRAIARELHDRVGQSLTAINLNLSIIRDQLSTQILERVGNRLVDSINLLEETIPAVRDLMSNLRPALLDDYGLITALKTHLKEFSARYGIHVSFEEPVRVIPRLSNNIEITLLRIAQEAMFNIAKHAHASNVTVSLLSDDSSIFLTVQDNGVGMDSLEPDSRSNSHGLAIMRERAEAVGGTFMFFSQPQKGTKIEVNIPITLEGGTERQMEVSQ